MNTPEFFIQREFGLFDLSLGVTLAVAIRYILFAGLAWLLGYVCFKHRWFHRKIIARLPAPSEVRREMAYSALSILIFGMVGAATIFAGRQGWTQMYRSIGDYGWGWFCGSIVCAIFLHDTYFYWTHRLMHHPKLFGAFHRVHHLSKNPSPWAAYAFSPLEAIVQAVIFPLIVLVLPMHVFAFGLFMFWQILFNVLGHTGYEFHPHTLMDSRLKRILNTPTNHVMHHEKLKGNYGLYFNIWDRLMGTNHAEYEDRFREVTRRKNQPTIQPTQHNT